MRPLVRPSTLYELIQTQAYVHRLYSDETVRAAVMQKHQRENNLHIEDALGAILNTPNLKSALRFVKREKMGTLPFDPLNLAANEYPDWEDVFP